MSSPNVSSDLDLLPTILLKACLDSVLGQITNVTVLSLNSGKFPDDFKHGHVNPVLKKVCLPKDDLNNYNISIIPKVVASGVILTQIIYPICYSQRTNNSVL